MDMNLIFRKVHNWEFAGYEYKLPIDIAFDILFARNNKKRLEHFRKYMNNTSIKNRDEVIDEFDKNLQNDDYVLVSDYYSSSVIDKKH